MLTWINWPYAIFHPQQVSSQVVRIIRIYKNKIDFSTKILYLTKILLFDCINSISVFYRNFIPTVISLIASGMFLRGIFKVSKQEKASTFSLLLLNRELQMNFSFFSLSFSFSSSYFFFLIWQKVMLYMLPVIVLNFIGFLFAAIYLIISFVLGFKAITEAKNKEFKLQILTLTIIWFLMMSKAHHWCHHNIDVYRSFLRKQFL